MEVQWLLMRYLSKAQWPFLECCNNHRFVSLTIIGSDNHKIQEFDSKAMLSLPRRLPLFCYIKPPWVSWMNQILFVTLLALISDFLQSWHMSHFILRWWNTYTASIQTLTSCGDNRCLWASRRKSKDEDNFKPLPVSDHLKYESVNISQPDLFYQPTQWNLWRKSVQIRDINR